MAYYGPKQCRDCWRGLRPLIDNGDGTHTVVLTKGKVALIDSADAERVEGISWHYMGVGYAATNQSHKAGSRGVIYLHRFILDAQEGEFVDHANRDRLDCRRSNLRIAEFGQNVHNSTRKPGSSGYFGVSKRSDGKKWCASIRVNGKSIHLGSFESAEVAARAYDESATLHYGEFALLNFPTPPQ